MLLSVLDLGILLAFFVLSLVIGLAVTKRSSSSSSEYFLGGRNMPYWLLGVSMVATTFAIDTPNLVAGIVRRDGVAGNWVWWAFLLNGLLTVFVFARLWRRSGVKTDLEFYELRYSGRGAAFLRGFRAVYLGVFFNVMIMATVCLAGVKLGSVMFGASPVVTLCVASAVTLVYSSFGGFVGVLATDLFQFGVAMAGSIGAAVWLVDLPQVGGLSALVRHPNVQDKLALLPDFSNSDAWMTLLVLPLCVQWWSVWYPGSEPGGGGYVAQRMLAAKDERHAIGATLFFNWAHYALRPWPWILVALASLIVFPTRAALQAAFPHMPAELVQDDLSYPAMLTLLPSGLLGLVVTSLVAAFTSTISTHLNWGSSYLVNDVYQRFIDPDASEEKLVRLGRLSTALLMLLGAFVALALQSSMQAFEILLQMGAGTGLVFVLRWLWWRVNAATEISAMIASLLVAVILPIACPELGAGLRLVVSVAVTSVVWLAATWLTEPTSDETLERFFLLTRPPGPGWAPVRARIAASQQRVEPASSSLGADLMAFVAGTFAIYAMLFGTGLWLYGRPLLGGGAVLLGGAVLVALGVRAARS
ncbi:MAG TPA: sodium:solute symporter family protein [Polyangiaceae bacterium]|nr:sodium:solute symporter family protein [Polyangiaceae bacterium]